LGSGKFKAARSLPPKLLIGHSSLPHFIKNIILFFKIAMRHAFVILLMSADRLILSPEGLSEISAAADDAFISG
jgi:hypothetical protein